MRGPSKPKLLIASTNEGKLREFRQIASHHPLDVVGLDSLGEDPDFRERGSTFREVARAKAAHYHRIHRLPTIADDSGLVVDALHGRPGVKSSRYLGVETPFSEKMASILERLDGLPRERRGARFTCALALVAGGTAPAVILKHVFGFITEEPKGAGGFGYDPIFFCPELDQTFGEASEKDKNRVSHRGHAIRALAALLETHPQIRRAIGLHPTV